MVEVEAADEDDDDDDTEDDVEGEVDTNIEVECRGVVELEAWVGDAP